VPGYLAGRRPRSKGRRYPADPPRTEEIIAVMRCAGEGLHGARARGLIVALWRAKLRIQGALEFIELDLDPRRGSVLVRRGKGGRRRRLGPSKSSSRDCRRARRCRSALFCAINGRTGGRHGRPRARVAVPRWRAARAGVRRRSMPYQLRHARNER
jgi:hypothetical protein